MVQQVWRALSCWPERVPLLKIRGRGSRGSFVREQSERGFSGGSNTLPQLRTPTCWPTQELVNTNADQVTFRLTVVACGALLITCLFAVSIRSTSRASPSHSLEVFLQGFTVWTDYVLGRTRRAGILSGKRGCSRVGALSSDGDIGSWFPPPKCIFDLLLVLLRLSTNCCCLVLIQRSWARIEVINPLPKAFCKPLLESLKECHLVESALGCNRLKLHDVLVDLPFLHPQLLELGDRLGLLIEHAKVLPEHMSNGFHLFPTSVTWGRSVHSCAGNN